MNKHSNTKTRWLRPAVLVQIRVLTAHSDPPRDRLGMALQGRPSWKRANGWDSRHSEKHRFPLSPFWRSCDWQSRRIRQIC